MKIRNNLFKRVKKNPRKCNAQETEYQYRIWMYCQIYGHSFENFPCILHEIC